MEFYNDLGLTINRKAFTNIGSYRLNNTTYKLSNLCTNINILKNKTEMIFVICDDYISGMNQVNTNILVFISHYKTLFGSGTYDAIFKELYNSSTNTFKTTSYVSSSGGDNSVIIKPNASSSSQYMYTIITIYGLLM